MYEDLSLLAAQFWLLGISSSAVSHDPRRSSPFLFNE